LEALVESFNFLMMGFGALMTPERLGFLFLGVTLGLLVGVLPGVGGTTGVAVLLPITVFFDPTAALVMLAGIYWGAIFGGVVTSILFSVPGNPWSVAVMFDGVPLAKQGKAGLAMSAAFSVSFIGAIIAAVFFTVATVPFAEMALKFGPPEMFAVLMIAFGTFVGLGGHPGKALAMVCLGLLLASVGLDPMTGMPRLTFGSVAMLQGFDFVPVTIGLYGVGEVLNNAAERYKFKMEDVSKAAKLGWENVRIAFRELRRRIVLVVGSAFLGFFTGILPGVGATPSSFIAYGLAQRTSNHPEEFGKGRIDGVMAPEAANNAAATSSLLPMLVLGIPGSPTAAIIMAGVFMWGFIPGPRLFVDAPDLVWAFIASLYVANLFAFVVCMTATPLLAYILRTPYALLAPVIVALSVVGAYSIQNSIIDVWLVLIFGLVGFVLRRLDFPLAPLVVALVLGFRTETSLRQSLILSDGSFLIFFERPIAAPLMIVAIVFFLLPAIQALVGRLRRKAGV